MARQEADREDILREATALVERLELRVPGGTEPIVVGFRRDGSASFFFGADPVFQFNASGELRRGFVSGNLLKAVAGRLVTMHRVRTQQEVELRSRPLSDQESQSLLADVITRLQQLRLAWQADDVHIERQVPSDRDVAQRVRDWLAANPGPFSVAAAPHAR